MRKIALVALALMAGATLSFAQKRTVAKKRVVPKVVKAPAVPEKKPAVQLLSGSDSISYAAGYTAADIVRDRLFGSLAKELAGTRDSLQLKLAYKGLFDALNNDTTVLKAQRAEWIFNSHMSALRMAQVEQQKAAGKAFLAENAQKEGVVTLPSGLQYKVLQQGTGAVPKADDQVQVKYEGRLIDGTVFDSTDKHGGKPATFSPNLVIAGWGEALQLMPVGSRWLLYIPQELGYGSRQTGPIPAYSTLIFDVEVVGIEGQQTEVKAKGKKRK